MTTRPPTSSLSEIPINVWQQMATKLVMLGQATMQAYAAGELDHPSLLPLCMEIVSLEPQLFPSKTEMDDPAPSPVVAPVPSESVSLPEPAPVLKPRLPEPEIAPALNKGTPTLVTHYTPPPSAPVLTCQQCGTPLVSGRKFCTRCGASVMPTGAITPANQSQPSTATPTKFKCTSCNEVVPPDALFCTNCGYQLRPQNPGVPVSRPLAPTVVMSPPIPTAGIIPSSVGTPSSSITQYCNNCGLGLPATVTVCPDCGSRDIGN